ncbi:MAG TPA: LysM peptidoglycan-binding domain-containing protein [Candidatus Limnocylindria bacterium]|nr:LysM peptidoglycan-binding domain-containing protein [Candidatus Limnocylindria bacterium]
MSRRPLPFRRLAALVALVAVGAIAVPAAAADRVVVVQAGDTLSQIALEQGVSLDQLVAWNGIADADRIFVGQRLRVSDAPDPSTSQQTVAPAPVVHVVRSGENLTFIAQRYGTTIAAIVAANGIANPSYVQAGQRLVIGAVPAPAAGSAAAPAPAAAAQTPAPAPAAQPRIHTVVAGENLTFIARRYGTTIGAIVAVNGLVDPSYLRVGQVLAIPGSAADSAEPAGALPTGMRAAVAARSDVRAIITEEARAGGVPVAFALAVAWQESGWQPSVVSGAGAVGVMQLTPDTADWVAATMLGSRIDLRDARSNVRGGVTLLRHYLDRYGGDKSMTLAAYFQGQTGADRHGIYPVTRPYIASVLALEAYFAR